MDKKERGRDKDFYTVFTLHMATIALAGPG